MSLLRQDVHFDSLRSPVSHADFQASLYWGVGVYAGKFDGFYLLSANS